MRPFAIDKTFILIITCRVFSATDAYLEKNGMNVQNASIEENPFTGDDTQCLKDYLNNIEKKDIDYTLDSQETYMDEGLSQLSE